MAYGCEPPGETGVQRLKTVYRFYHLNNQPPRQPSRQLLYHLFTPSLSILPRKYYTTLIHLHQFIDQMSRTGNMSGKHCAMVQATHTDMIDSQPQQLHDAGVEEQVLVDWSLVGTDVG